jgi:EpsI family protein
MLFIVYSQNNRKVSHPPEICYTGSGATILNKTKVDLGENNGHLGAERLTAQLGHATLMIYYWFKWGNSFTPDYWKQQSMIALKSLMGQSVSSAMIRLSVECDGKDIARADRVARNFSRLILPVINQYLP